MGKGKVIVFDGPDGVGKTTQLELTAEWLRKEGFKVFTTRASGGTEIGKALRAASLSDAPRSTEVDVYISLAMHTAVAQEIDQKRQEDFVILVDRSPMAIVAYNVFGGQLQDRKLGLNAFEKLMQAWHPDLCLYIDVPQNVADERRSHRNDNQKPTDYFEKQDHAFHDRVRQGYQKALTLLKDNPAWYGKLEEINGTPDKEAVQKSIQQSITKLEL